MATTDDSLQPYSEDDKLGPLGSRASALRDPLELRAKLITEFNSAVQAAREAAANIDDHSAQAVHDSRKALRRARCGPRRATGAASGRCTRPCASCT